MAVSVFGRTAAFAAIFAASEGCACPLLRLRRVLVVGVGQVVVLFGDGQILVAHTAVGAPERAQFLE